MKKQKSSLEKEEKDMMLGKLDDLTVDFNKIKDYDLLMFPLDIWQEMTIYNKELQERITKKYNEAIERCPDKYEQFCEMVEWNHITFSEMHRLVNIRREKMHVIVNDVLNKKLIEEDKTGFKILDKQGLKDYFNPMTFNEKLILARNFEESPTVKSINESKFKRIAQSIDDGHISVSFLQRILCIGYSRASNCIEELIRLNLIEREDYKCKILNAELVKKFFENLIQK